MLAGFAGFTLAAAMAALYLWEERRLKRRERRSSACGCLRSTRSTGSRPAPCSARSCCSTPASSSAPRSFERGDFDAPMAVTLVIWALYASLLSAPRGLARTAGRVAVLAGFALVAIVLPLTHFAS